MKLTHKQTLAIDALDSQDINQVIYGGGAGGGKSALGCYWVLKRRFKYPGTRGVIGRSVLKTLKETTLNSFFEVCAMQGIKAGIHYKYNQQKGVIDFYNGSQILLKDLYDYPSDPDFDELGSLEITDAFVDEAVQVSKKAWDVLYSRIRYKLDDYDLTPSMLGTTNPGRGHIYTDYYLPYTNNNLPSDKAFIPSLAKDNPYVSKHYIDSLLKMDENSIQRLLHGNWEYDDDPAALVTYTDIMSLSDVEIIKGVNHCGADIARMGDDKTTFVKSSGNWFKDEWIRTYDNFDTAQVANKLIRYLSLEIIIPENCGIDTVGLGAGVYDNMKEKGYKAVEVISGAKATKSHETFEFKNLRSQMWWQFREDCKKGKIRLNSNDEELLTDLSAPRYKIVNEKMIQVESKEDIKKRIGRSPDKGDALVYCNAMRSGIIKSRPTLKPQLISI